MPYQLSMNSVILIALSVVAAQLTFLNYVLMHMPVIDGTKIRLMIEDICLDV